MPYTPEPRGLAFINNLNTASFGSLVTNACWFLGSSALTTVACMLLLREDYHLANGTLVIVEMQRQLGLTLSGFLLGAWTGKTVAGVADAHSKRQADPRYAEVLEAKERGKVSGAAAAVVIAEKAADMQAARNGVMTGEHPAQQPVVQVNAEQGSRVETNVGTSEGPAVQAKVATLPDAYTDDERGD
ncbi:MAG TPA: hypothetical protein VGP44_11850 [Gemmatimonadales bacterium]|nr:hypothetical protein [Gemmatimonadales bacterium]